MNNLLSLWLKLLNPQHNSWQSADGNHENTENIESKVVLKTKKLPITIKSPIMIVGLTEEASVISV